MNRTITPLKVVFTLMCLAMIALTIKTSLEQNLFQVLPDMLRHPWMVATFVDFYFNLLIIWSWVVYKENNLTRSLLWLVAFIALGSIATAFYVLLQLKKWRPGQPLESVFLRARTRTL